MDSREAGTTSSLYGILLEVSSKSNTAMNQLIHIFDCNLASFR